MPAVCVEFIGTAYNDLLNLILNGTVQTCSDLCEQLSGNLLPTVCTLVCDYAGIKEFIKVISESNGPDEIYICTKLHTCEECLGEAAFESLNISPSSGPAGTTFSFETTYNVTKKTCAGEFGIEIQGGDSFPIESADLYEGQIPGTYSSGWSLKATPSQQDPFSPGSYQVRPAPPSLPASSPPFLTLALFPSPRSPCSFAAARARTARTRTPRFSPRSRPLSPSRDKRDADNENHCLTRHAAPRRRTFASLHALSSPSPPLPLSTTMTDLNTWWVTMGSVTRALLIGALVVTVGGNYGMLPVPFTLDLSAVFYRLHLWRVVTPYLFFGRLGFACLMNMFMLSQYSSRLETTSYADRTADYVVCVAFGLLTMLLPAYLIGLQVMGTSLLMYLIYIWSQRNPTATVSFYFFSMQAAYLPWFLTVFHLLLGAPASPWVELAGIASGHTFFFLEDILPAKGGRKWIQTPQFLYRLFPSYAAQPNGRPGFRGPAQPVHRGGYNWGGGQALGRG